MNTATNTVRTMTATAPMFRPETLEIVTIDPETCDLLDEDGALGLRCNFWAVLDRTAGGVKVCVAELGKGTVQLITETTRELFADDVIRVP